ncbi:MAG: hypothetical protein ISS55_00440 [Dehalococcoidales bacterium]|nr:hypothetical protein [Dehalococcoidales bacterium]
MVREKINATIIMEEDIDSLLAEWDMVPAWIKVHVSAKRPAHRYEGQFAMTDEGLFFMGRDMKEGKSFEMEIPTESITSIGLGFSERMQESIDPVFGAGGPVPIAVEFSEDGRTRRAYISTCADNYSAHMNVNNARWYEMLDETLAERERHDIPVRREREPVLA